MHDSKPDPTSPGRENVPFLTTKTESHKDKMTMDREPHALNGSSSSLPLPPLVPMDRPYLFRRVCFYLMLATLIADVYTSDATVLNYLTLWSWILHTLYFELPLLRTPWDQVLIRLLHGPSFCGSHALLAMYIWTLIANPQMELDLAPVGRTAPMVYLRAAWLHVTPVILHWMDIRHVEPELKRAYHSANWSQTSRMLLYLWSSVGGYFAMGLTWENVNGAAAATYNVTRVSEATFLAVGKAVGVAACLVAFGLELKPRLLSDSIDSKAD